MPCLTTARVILAVVSSLPEERSMNKKLFVTLLLPASIGLFAGCNLQDEHGPVEPWPAHARWARVGGRACLPCPATEPAAALPQRGHATGAAGANARAPSSARQQPLLVPRLHPRGAPLDQSDEEGAHRVVDLHEAPRHPSVDASGRSGLLRRRIFPCGHHRVPDHLREREPPLTRMNHRLRRSRCLLVAPAALPLEGFQHPRSERFGRKRS